MKGAPFQPPPPEIKPPRPSWLEEQERSHALAIILTLAGLGAVVAAYLWLLH